MTEKGRLEECSNDKYLPFVGVRDFIRVSTPYPTSAISSSFLIVLYITYFTPEPYLMGLDPRRAEEVNSPSLLCPTIAHTMFSAIGMG